MNSANSVNRNPRTNGATGSSLTDIIGGVINVKDSPYGALGNNTGDDQPAIHAAYNAACAAAHSGQGSAAVYLPPGVYKTLSPIVESCYETQPALFGAGGLGGNTLVHPAFVGPAVMTATAGVTFPSYLGVTLTSNIIPGGSDNSLTWVNSTGAGGIDLNMVLGLHNVGGSTSTGPFNTLSAFDIQGHIEPSQVSAQHCIWASDGALNSNKTVFSSPASNITGAYGEMGYLCHNSSGELYGAMNIGGTMTHLNSGSTHMSNGTEYEVEMNYDSATGNANLYLGGGTVTRVAQNTGLSGNITQRIDENNILGGDMSTWPYSGFANWAGSLQSVRFSKVTRNTAASYSEDTGNYTSDSKTLYLQNNSLSNFPNNTPVFQVEKGSGSGPWWETLMDTGTGCCSGFYHNHDFEIDGSETVGIFANGAAVELERTPIGYIAGLIGVETSGNATFGSVIKDENLIGFTGYLTGLMAVGGIQSAENITTNGSYAAVLGGNSVYKNFYMDPNQGTTCPIALVGSGGFDLKAFDFDTENGGTFPGLCIQSGTTVTVENSFIVPSGAAAPIELYGALSKLTLDSNSISIGGTVVVDASNVHGVGGGSGGQTGPISATSKVVFRNNTYNNSDTLPSGVSYTNNGLAYDASQNISQFSQLQMPILPKLVSAARAGCVSSPCSVASPPLMSPGHVLVAIADFPNNAVTVTVPNGWTLGCSIDDHGTSGQDYKTYTHVIAVNEPTTNSWGFTNGYANFVIVQLQGVNQINPSDRCFTGTGTASATYSATGGTQTDINGLVISMVGNSGGAPIVFASPPSGFMANNNIGAANQDYVSYNYLPSSQTVPALSVSVAPGTPTWASLQATFLPDQAWGTAMPYNAGVPPCWYGESGCSLNGLFLAGPAPVISSCGGTTAPTKGSTNSFGEVTGGGAATACTVTFSNGGFPNFAACSLTDEMTPKGLTLSSLSKRGFTTNNITAGDKFTYACGGN